MFKSRVGLCGSVALGVYKHMPEDKKSVCLII